MHPLTTEFNFIVTLAISKNLLAYTSKPALVLNCKENVSQAHNNNIKQLQDVRSKVEEFLMSLKHLHQ